MNLKSVYNLNPYVALIYFVAIIIFSVCILNPFCIAATFLAALLFVLKTEGKKALKFYIIFIFPTSLIAAILNPLFNHLGNTELFYLPNGIAITFESLVYGISLSGVLASVMGWFYSFNKIMTSDKIVYVSGKFAPSVSLLFSMILRFAPRFKTQLSEISLAQKSMGISDKNKIKAASEAVLTEIGIALENSIETADCMKARGYGVTKRTFYSNYKFNLADKLFLAASLIMTALIIYFWVSGRYSAQYYPNLSFAETDIYSYSTYTLFAFMPLILEFTEEIRWKLLQSKI